MFSRLVAESLRRNSRSKLVALAAIALGLTAATALVEVLVASGDRLAAEMGSYGANIEVVPRDGKTFEAAHLGEIRTIFWRHNIVAVAPLLDLRVRFEPADVVAPLVGTWFDVDLDEGPAETWRTGLPAVRPTLAVDGRWPRDGEPEVVLGRRLAQRLGVGTGGTVTTELAGRRRELAVVGVMTSGGDEDEQAVAPLAVVHALAGKGAAAADGLPGGPVVRAELFALTNPEAENAADPESLTPEEYDRWYCTPYPSSVAHQISEAMPDADGRVLTGVTETTAAVLGRLDRVLIVLATVVLLGATVGVSAATTATVLERRLEAGLLVALGAEVWRVVAFFLTEAVVLGLAGGLLGGVGGLAAGRLLGHLVFDVTVAWVPLLLPVAAGVGIAVAVAGAAVPVARVLRGRPALMLKRATA